MISASALLQGRLLYCVPPPGASADTFGSAACNSSRDSRARTPSGCECEANTQSVEGATPALLTALSAPNDKFDREFFVQVAHTVLFKNLNTQTLLAIYSTGTITSIIREICFLPSAEFASIAISILTV